MASTLNERFELIEPLPVAPGDFARVAYKAREIVESAGTDTARGVPEEAPIARVVVLRLLPVGEVSPELMQASDTASKLKAHPNILSHFEIARIESQADIEPGWYFVSEFSRGLTLRERIRRVAPFSLAVTLDIGLAVTKALVYAGNRDIAHGGLRPESVLLTPEGQVRVGDFVVGAALRKQMGQASGGNSDDIRAVGLLLYEMLTGVAPDQMGETSEISPREINPAIAPAIDGVVRKATSLSPGRKYASLDALASDLQTARDDLRTGKPLTWSPLAAGKAAAPRGASAPAAAGALTQAAEEIAAENNRKRRKPSSETAATSQGGNALNPAQEEALDDFDRAGSGSPVFSRVIMFLFVVLVVGVIAASAYFATQLSIPNDVVVPDLIGKQFSDAQQTASRQHLNLDKVGDDYSDTWPAGTIYQMSPPPGRTIKPGKEIDVYVSDGPRLTDVPDLTQLPIDRARKDLMDAGLPLGTIATDYSDTVPKNSVISQQPDAGSKVSHDTPVNITISKGPAPPPAPDGLSASSTLPGEIDLSWSDVPDATTYDVYRDGKRIATGLPQSAYSDTNLGDGETHSYTVTAVNANGESQPSQPATSTTPQPQAPDQTVPGVPPPDISAPAPVPANGNTNTGLRQRQFDIRFKVPYDGADRHNVQIEVQDATGTNIFYDQDRDAGDTVDENVTAFGNKVIFRIFIDGKLVKQQVK